MSREYVVPFSRAAAFMRTIHKLRNSRFFFLRSLISMQERFLDMVLSNRVYFAARTPVSFG